MNGIDVVRGDLADPDSLAASLGKSSAARKRSAEIGSLAITSTFITSPHTFARQQQLFGQHIDHLGARNTP